MKYQNLGEFLRENSQKHKNRIGYEIKRGLRSQRFTFSEVYSFARKTATFLQLKGLEKGDKVAIWSANMPEYAILYFGIWLMGGVAVPIDIRTTEETLKAFLTKAKCKIGFKGKFIPGNFGKLVKESFYLEDLTSHLEGVNLNHLRGGLHWHLKVERDDLAEIAFTSGTTGTPKGVMLTHGNFLSDVESLTAVFPFKKEYRALSLLPLSHAFEQVVGLLATYQAGIKVTYLERINALTILRALRKRQITSVALVPQALRLLMNGIEREVERQGKTKKFAFVNKIAPYLPKFARRFVFQEIHRRLGGNLLFFGCGSAPLDLKLAQKWENLGVEVFEGYGATETTAAQTINTPGAKRLGSVGKVLPGMEVRINPQSHEIEAKGPNISPGYFEDPEKTKAAFFNNWYKTGDVGELDQDGFLYITGREAFRIVLPDGRKVYPEDLEKKLNTHPLVQEACVVGVRREEGEVVHAAVITNSPHELAQIIRDINQSLASHEQILEWSHWPVDDFPRTPILKIDRKKVSEFVEKSRLTPQGWLTMTPAVTPRKGDKLVGLIAQVTKALPSKIKETSTLATDLKLDSLGRVELLSRVEQELGVAIPETKITPQTKVSQLRELIKVAPTIIEEIPVNEFMYSPFMMKLRAYILQNIIFRPLHSLFVPLEVRGQENLTHLRLPAIFYFNHIGIFDGVCVMRCLPNSLRAQLVTVIRIGYFERWERRWIEILGGGIPFDRDKKIKASLELVGEFMDKGYSLLISPEGRLTRNGEIPEFKPGTGLLAVELQAPVVPVKIDKSYMEIFPPQGGSFREYIPKKRKKISVVIGKPIIFSKETSYEEATKKMREALLEISN